MRTPSPITAVLVAVAAALVGNLATNTVQVTWTWWPLTIWTTVVILVLVTLRIEYARHRAAAPHGKTEGADAAKQVLAGLVAGQWRTEAILRSLDDPDPISVQWHLTGNRQVMDHPANLTPASLRLKASSDDIAALVRKFRAMKRRRLVILGGPGAGKTTLAVQLVRELLDTRAAHPEEPVPVLLSVAGWDTTAD